MKPELKTACLAVIFFILAELVGMEAFIRFHRFTARDKPSYLETLMAEHVRMVSVPSDVKKVTNPRAATPQILKDAGMHWSMHCATCHGLDGKGDTPIGRGLYPKPPNMLSSIVQRRSDGELFYIINKGVRLTGMPAWEGEDSPEELWDLVSFIRQMPKMKPEEFQAIGKSMPEETEKGSGHAVHHHEAHAAKE